MRIIAGEARRTVIRAPAGTDTRPTGDRVREAVFAILGPIDREAPAPTVLDLFSGTGALGLEAVSRGAAHCVLVERDPECVRLCAANAERARLSDRVRILAADVRRALRQLEGESARFDWIFCDPPYSTDDLETTLERLGTGRLLGEYALVIAEHSPRRPPAERFGVLGLSDRRRWGDTEVTFYRA